MVFGPRDEPIEGYIFAVVLFEDCVRYRVAGWVNSEPVSYEMPIGDFQVLPSQGPRPLRIGFASKEQK